MRALLVILVVLAALPVSGAENCGYIRLDAPGGSMEHVGVRAQGSYGICYSETAVQMADAYRFSHPDLEGGRDYSFQGSALIASIETSQTMKEVQDYNETLLKEGKMAFAPGDWAARPVGNFHPDYEKFDSTSFSAGDLAHGGEVCPMYNHLQKSGIRQNLDIEMTGNYWRGPIWLLSSEYMRVYYEKHPEERSSFTDWATPKPLGQAIASVGQCLKSQGVSVGRDRIFEALQSDTEATILTLFLETRASERKLKLPQNVQCIPSFPKKRSELLADIDAHFNQKNVAIQPIGTSICRNFINLSDYSGFNWNTHSWKKDCSAHALLIIGRRKNPKSGRCQLLLRDSAGESESHSSDWDMEKGNIWVDQDAFAANANELDILKEH